MNLYDKFIFEYTTGRRKSPNLKYKFKDSDEIKVLNIGALLRTNDTNYRIPLQKRLYGKILDVGAGLGKFSRLVPNTYSLDISKTCCNYLRSRGFPHIIESDIFNHYDKYDSMILIMNNIGMTGDYDRTIELINHLKSLLNENGQIIFDYKTSKQETTVKEFSWLDDNNIEENESHTWTFLCRDNIEKIAKEIGMHFEVLHEAKNDTSLGRFYLDNTKFHIHATSRSGHNFFMETLKSWRNSIILINGENSKKIVDDKKSIIFLRDYLNTVASICASKFRPHNIDRIIISTVKSWKYLYTEAATGKYNIVYYERFISDKSYRQDICKLVGGKYNETMLNKLPEFAPSSSFDDKLYDGRAQEMPVNDRWKLIEHGDAKYFNLFLKTLKENLDVLVIYLKNYDVPQDKLDFIYKHVISEEDFSVFQTRI